MHADNFIERSRKKSAIFFEIIIYYNILNTVISSLQNKYKGNAFDYNGTILIKWVSKNGMSMILYFSKLFTQFAVWNENYLRAYLAAYFKYYLP